MKLCKLAIFIQHLRCFLLAQIESIFSSFFPRAFWQRNAVKSNKIMRDGRMNLVSGFDAVVPSHSIRFV